MNNSKLLKIIGYFCVIVLILNLFLMAFRVYTILVFWIVIAVVAIVGFGLI